MKVQDPDWVRIFGHDDSQLEKPPGKPTKPAKLKNHQRQAKLISEQPELLGGKVKTPQRQLFE